MPRKTATAIRLDLRDARLIGGRLVISLRTANRKEAVRREAAIRRLMERGEWGVLERIRARLVRVEDAVALVESGDIARLRGAVGAGAFTLGPRVDHLLNIVPAGSLGNYAAILGLLRAEYGDGYAMERMTKAEATAWLRRPKSTNAGVAWSPGRRELARVLIGRLWDDAIYAAREDAERTGDRPVLSRNPWKDAAPTRGTQEEILPRSAYLTRAQWDRLIASVRGTERAALYGLCCLAGLRRQEASMLRVGLDVEMPAGGRGRVRVQARDGEFAWKPKTRRSVRDVPMNAELRALIEEHIRLGYSGDRFLFHTPGYDRPLNRDTPTTWAESDFPAAGLAYGRSGDLTLHSLRHTFASWLVQRGADLLMVATLMGDTLDMVAKVYAHLRPVDLERTVDLLDEPDSVHNATRNATDNA
jgi:integrase